MKRKFTKFPSKITASTKPHPKIPAGWDRVPEGDDDDGNWGTISKALPDNQGYYWINITEDDEGRRCFELEVGYRGDDGSIGKIWKAASKPFYRLGDIVKYADTKWKQLQAEYDEDVEACGDITTSTKIHANSDCYLDTQTGDSYTYDDLKEYWYSFKDWDYSLADFTSFEDWFNTSIENGIFTPCDEVEACGDIKASTSSRDIESLAREALNCNTKEELSQVIGSLLSIDKKLYLHYMELLRDDSVSISYIASQLSDELMNYGTVEGCGDIKASSDTKYLATMVNCSEDELDDEFLVEGYYDNQYRGLAESAETSDVSALNELINDYANRGYFIRVHNLTDGVITEFSPDNWFDDLARDGGAALFMSW